MAIASPSSEAATIATVAATVAAAISSVATAISSVAAITAISCIACIAKFAYNGLFGFDFRLSLRYVHWLGLNFLWLGLKFAVDLLNRFWSGFFTFSETNNAAGDAAASALSIDISTIIISWELDEVMVINSLVKDDRAAED